MARLCERPGCSERGAIAYGFDPVRLLVWLSPFDPESDRNRSGVLCLRHGDAMVVPRGWTLDDARDPGPRLFKAPAQPVPTARTVRRRPAGAKERTDQLLLVDPVDNVRALPGVPVIEQPVVAVPEPEPVVPAAASDEARTVAAVTGRSAATVEDPDATVAIPWKPDFDDTDDLGGVLDATSPLLSRAFRGRERSH